MSVMCGTRRRAGARKGAHERACSLASASSVFSRLCVRWRGLAGPRYAEHNEHTKGYLSGDALVIVVYGTRQRSGSSNGAQERIACVASAGVALLCL